VSSTKKHVLRQPGEEHLALAGDPHQRRVLVRERPADELADAAGTLVVERDLALVGDHHALDREHVRAERRPHHLAVLLHPPLTGLDLGVRGVEQVAAHGLLPYAVCAGCVLRLPRGEKDE
jgi:hypothetical protein